MFRLLSVGYTSYLVRGFAMRLRVLGMLAFVFALLPSAANAAYVLEFGQGGTAGITSFNAAPGDMITIELYLTQTGADALLTNKGIATMALDFTIDGAGG